MYISFAYMNLKEEILREHSKKQCDAIAKWVGNSQQRFDDLFNLFAGKESKVTQRASWPLSYCVESFPFLIIKNIPQLIEKLRTPLVHNAIKRNSTRLLLFVDIPDEFQGEVMDICFSYLSSPSEAVATKANAMYILARLAKEYPDIVPEIRLILEDQQYAASAGFAAAIRKTLKQLPS